ncbi:acetylxylan esterase [Actinomadura scrupuli]|uniref:acetylxylan esterase n=1 Tax=Actinomadura scrupuli TaxID=559629 RepID=UPI003D97B683
MTPKISHHGRTGARSRLTATVVRGKVFHTLSYFDGLNFATRATSPALFSVALDGLHLPGLDGLRGLQPLHRNR